MDRKGKKLAERILRLRRNKKREAEEIDREVIVEKHPAMQGVEDRMEGAR